MTEFTPPTAEELAAIRKSTNLSAAEFGTLLGYKDPARVVRALELGERHGKPYQLSGPGTAALAYARALVAILDAGADCRAQDKAIAAAEALIPKRMRK